MENDLKAVFKSSNWYNAVTLTERATNLENIQYQTLNLSFDVALAKERLDKWKNSRPFQEKNVFNQRLSLDNLNTEKAFYIFGESLESLQERCKDYSLWLDKLFTIFSDWKEDVASNEELPLFSSDNNYFELLINPLIKEGSKKLGNELQKLHARYKVLPFYPNNIKQIFLKRLIAILNNLIAKTIFLEINVASLRGELKGETPEERYNFFIKNLSKRDFSLSILKKYPVLARQIVLSIEIWLDSSSEFLTNLCNNWEAICLKFNTDRLSTKIKNLEIGVGDTHKRGRSVIIIEFDSSAKLVYKPRSLSIDINFQSLLNWLNEKGDHPPFKILEILDFKTHGWVEYVENIACVSEDEADRFYTRQGCYLALLYGLEATDFHFENLVACGEHPVLIDLESLFHPRKESDEKIIYFQELKEKVINSVLRVGLLPRIIWLPTRDKSTPIDLSGLGGGIKNTVSHEFPQWKDLGTDKVNLGYRKANISARNLPEIDGKKIAPIKYSESISEGFRLMYRLLQRYKTELASDVGQLSIFAKNEIRYIPRPTYVYKLFLDAISHPDLLRNALDRDCFLNKLWLGLEEQKYLAKLIPAELFDLQNGDIPFFSTNTDLLDIFTSDNRRIQNYFATSGLELARNRINNLNNEDLDLQLWFVKSSFISLEIETENESTSKKYSPVFHPKSNDLVKLAENIGDSLISLAAKDNKSISWVGDSLIKQKELRSTGIELGEGHSGIALFFMQLGLSTYNNKFIDLAYLILDTAKTQINQQKNNFFNIGAFTGWGGWIYVLAYLGTILQDQTLLKDSQNAVIELKKWISKDSDFDIYKGAAGAILVLHGLYQLNPSDLTKETIIQCAEHLLSHTTSMEIGIGWKVPSMGRFPVAGFSHGNAGIVYALLLAWNISGKSHFKRAALEALEYERSLFSPQFGNWMDLRKVKNNITPEIVDNPYYYTTAWCHGAPGIGLARLNSLPYLTNSMVLEDLNTSYETTLSNGFGNNHCLCHGELGNADFLLQLHQKDNPTNIKVPLQKIINRIYESLASKGALCGNPLNVCSPGMLTGLAGIGYELLRFSDPDKIPSVLVLEFPSYN